MRRQEKQESRAVGTPPASLLLAARLMTSRGPSSRQSDRRRRTYGGFSPPDGDFADTRRLRARPRIELGSVTSKAIRPRASLRPPGTPPRRKGADRRARRERSFPPLRGRAHVSPEGARGRAGGRERPRASSSSSSSSWSTFHPRE